MSVPEATYFELQAENNRLRVRVAELERTTIVADHDHTMAEPTRESNEALLHFNAALQHEIAERRQIEAALRQSKERYRDLFDSVPVGLYRTTVDGRILDANLAVCHLLGYTDRESLLAQTAADQYVDPAERRRWRQLMEHQEVVTDFEVQWRRQDGSIIWVLDHARGIRDADGNLICYEGMVKDITARKVQAQALELQRNLALALNSAPDQQHALQIMLAQTLAIDGLTGGGVYLIDRDSGAAQLMLHQNLAPAFIEQVRFFPAESFEAQTVVDGIPIVWEGIAVPPFYREQHWQAVAIIPVQYEQQTIAVLNLGSTSQPFIPPAIKESIEIIQSQMGIVLARLQAEAAVHERDAMLDAFFETADIGLCITDAYGYFVRVNRAYCELYQYSPAELIGRHFTMILPPEQREHACRLHDAFIAGTPKMAGEWIAQRRDGSQITIHATTGLLALPDGRYFTVTTVTDISEQKRREAQIQYLAFTDQLTGLPNRNRLYSQGDALLTEAAEQQTPVTLLYLDIDRLKLINDTFGYSAGDEFLIHVATMLKRCLSHADLLARVGGDEFVALFRNTKTDEALRRVQHLFNCPQAPGLLGGEPIAFNACIGIAGSRAGNISLSQLLAQAENAMYHAKAQGRRVQVYDQAHSPMLQRQLRLENELRRALDQDALTLLYQPVLHIPGNRIRMVEALVRWNHPVRGLLSPDVFLPLAEELRLLDTLDRQVIRKALHQAADWQHRGYNLATSINISAPTLQVPELVAEIRDLLHTTGADAASVILEVTEHSALRDLPTSRQVLSELRTLGLRIALDDFGTGHASLTHLRQLPVDIVKLDRAFAAGIGQNTKDEAVIQTLLALGRGLKLDVVVEGIEHAEQLAWLRRQDCPFAQGYLLSKPCSVLEIEKLIAAS
jgi:diguanylate cyclase (GGDEF)-like protein/PAS domain S-box-containing protein